MFCWIRIVPLITLTPLHLICGVWLAQMETALRDGGVSQAPDGLQRPSDPPHPARCVGVVTDLPMHCWSNLQPRPLPALVLVLTQANAVVKRVPSGWGYAPVRVQ